MRVPSQGWEDSLEEEMATYSSILTGRIPWTEEPGGPQSIGLQRVLHNIAKTQAIYRFSAIKMPIAYFTKQISKTLI